MSNTTIRKNPVQPFAARGDKLLQKTGKVWTLKNKGRY